MTATEIQNLAVMFRTNHSDIGHVSTLDAMNQLGLGYMYGLFRGIPERHRNRRRTLRNQIATTLEQKAKEKRQ